MTLFNYEQCKMCKKCNNDIKIELSKILPANVCNKIGEYSGKCHKCKTILKQEDRFFKCCLTWVPSLIEKQIYLISVMCQTKFDFHLPYGQSLIEMKKQIDIIFDDPEVKEKYRNNKMLLQATKSWAKKDIHKVRDINMLMGDSRNLRKTIRRSIENRAYRFRKIEFDMIDILLCFVTEYVYYLCKYYINYMDKKELDKFIKDLFPVNL